MKLMKVFHTAGLCVTVMTDDDGVKWINKMHKERLD